MHTLGLSLCQKRFWLESKIYENSTAYNLNFFDIKGKLNEVALQNALSDLISRHECFRSYFIEKNKSLEQVILDRMNNKYIHYATEYPQFSYHSSKSPSFIEDNAVPNAV